MKIEFYCPLWGQEETPFEDFCKHVKSSGYDGVELTFPEDPDDRKRKQNIIENHDMKFIAQQAETVEPDFPKHCEEFRQRLLNLAALRPEFISSQTGLDWFEFEQNLELIDIAREIEEKTGIKITHESHRSKMLFAAHIAKKFIEQRSEMRCTLDISHWCAVAETLLGDQKETVDLVLSRTDHIHARVGFAEGPQVPDPFAPEWEAELSSHLLWWRKVLSRAEDEGKDRQTITCECGPEPYMWISPYSAEPLARQWDINLKMKDYLKEHLSSK